MINKFNIRVYGIIIRDGAVLALFEKYNGDDLIKFPGGGVEFGEGTLDCVKREFLEELNVKIKNLTHFYTQEEFVSSKFRENEQILTIYYLAEVEDFSQLKICDENIQKAEWISLSEENPLVLLVDKIVFEKLKSQFMV